MRVRIGFKQLCYFSAFFMLPFVLLSLPAHAQSELNISTSPLPISLSTKPGSSISADLRVKNSGSQTTKLKVSLMKFEAYGVNGEPKVLDRAPGDDYFDWVHFSKTTFDAEPNVWQTIKMTVDAPKTAAFGYYYAVVFSPADTKAAKGSDVNTIVGGSATLVLLDVKVPGAKRQIDVASFTSTHKFYEYLPVEFSLRLHNSGQVHVVPTGNIFIQRGGRNVGQISVNQGQGNILPNSNRVFTASWTDGFPVYQDKVAGDHVVLDKKGKPIEQLSWDFSHASKLRIGHYTAKLLLVYDNGQRDVPIEGTLSFWVIPWKLGLITFAVVLLAGTGLWSIGKNLWRKFKSKDKK